jgi:phosphoglycerol transferase MdoB-like AlkP superfamily enzyme
MRLSHITEFVIHHLFSRLKRRAIGTALLVLFALIAVYQLTIAGTLELEAEYGILYARLIVAAIYLAAALSALIVLWATRTMPPIKAQTADAQMSQRDMQIAALIEAALLGYAMARKSGGRDH